MTSGQLGVCPEGTCKPHEDRDAALLGGACATIAPVCLVSGANRQDHFWPVAAVDGNYANSYPFNGGPQHCQQIHGSSDFGTSMLHITGIAFRGDSLLSQGTANGSYPVTTVRSTTSKAVGGLSTTFAGNLGADAVTVFSGTVSIATTSGPPAPRPFEFVISFNARFDCNPTQGNLLLDVNTYGGTTDPALGTGFLDAVNGDGDSVSRVTSLAPLAPVGFADTIGLVTEFITVEPAALVPLLGPETPAVPALLIAGVAAMALRRSRQARK